MKAIFKVLLFAIPAILFAQCERFGEDELDPNDLVNIPDQVFLNAIINEGVDTNGDSLISYAEAEAIDTLICGGGIRGDGPFQPDWFLKYGDIKSLEGIEAFKNLLFLDCSHNVLINLDVSNNFALKGLDCDLNELESLDVSGCTKLTDLECGINKLTSLDVSNNPVLKILVCYSNQIQNIDVTNSPELIALDCQCNNLTNIDLSNNSILRDLYLADNQFASLDVSNNTALEYFGCGYNQLTTLNISNNIKLHFVGLTGMPILSEVCVWTIPFPPEGIGVSTYDSPNVHFTTDCSQ